MWRGGEGRGAGKDETCRALGRSRPAQHPLNNKLRTTRSTKHSYAPSSSYSVLRCSRSTSTSPEPHTISSNSRAVRMGSTAAGTTDSRPSRIARVAGAASCRRAWVTAAQYASTSRRLTGMEEPPGTSSTSHPSLREVWREGEGGWGGGGGTAAAAATASQNKKACVRKVTRQRKKTRQQPQQLPQPPHTSTCAHKQWPHFLAFYTVKRHSHKGLYTSAPALAPPPTHTLCPCMPTLPST
jgi:hypothetical protein